MARVLQYFLLPLFSRFSPAFLIIPDPVFICNRCPGFFDSSVYGNTFSVVDVAGADTAFYRLIRAAAEQSDRSSGSTPSFFRSTIPSAAALLARALCFSSRADNSCFRLPLCVHFFIIHTSLSVIIFQSWYKETAIAFSCMLLSTLLRPHKPFPLKPG